MTSALKQLKRRALARPDVKAAYDGLSDEFAFLDEVLSQATELAIASWPPSQPRVPRPETKAPQDGSAARRRGPLRARRPG